MSITLAELRTAVRRMADMETSSFVSDDEVNDYVNRAAARWHTRLSTKYEDWFTTYTVFTLTAASNIYTLPADFLKMRRLQMVDGGTASGWRKVSRASVEDMERVGGAWARAWSSAYRAYLILQNGLWLLPEDDASGSYRMWYLPRFVKMVYDTDAIGDWQDWYELVIVDAAIKCLNKEESDTSHLVQEREAIEARINSAAGRDAGEPPRVADVMGDDGDRLWR